MTRSLRIAEVAERVGISTATVRYYERIGVLPVAERAANGYRVYDERTVERLGFVTRAKQLGCTLDEIADLVTAWDGGECGPIQDRLRSLVADKIAAARADVGELAVLIDDLRRAEASLERHRPVGRCDDRCGCVVDASPDPSDAAAVTPAPTGDGAAIACTLPVDEVPRRLGHWNELVRAGGVTRSEIPGGVRFEFGDRIDVAELARLAGAEQDCCRFLSFHIAIEPAGVTLDVTAPDGGRDLVHAVFGAPA